jgi:hypothetical protein
VETPRGNITATLGGITQQALDGSIAGGPVVTLVAGTPGTPGYTGNIDLGESGVIGGEVNITANGSINAGLVLSRQNSTIVAAHNFTGTVLAGGSANVAGGGTVSGTIIGVGGAEVSGGSVTAEVLSQNASVNGGAAQTTLGTQANASAASQSAANQSNAQAQQQVASNTQADDDQKRNNKPKPALVRRVKRVTVLFPGET